MLIDRGTAFTRWAGRPGRSHSDRPGLGDRASFLRGASLRALGAYVAAPVAASPEGGRSLGARFAFRSHALAAAFHAPTTFTGEREHPSDSPRDTVVHDALDHIAAVRSQPFWGGVPNGSQLMGVGDPPSPEATAEADRTAEQAHSERVLRDPTRVLLRAALEKRAARAHQNVSGVARSPRAHALLPKRGVAGVGQDLYDPAVYAAPASDPTLYTPGYYDYYDALPPEPAPVEDLSYTPETYVAVDGSITLPTGELVPGDTPTGDGSTVAETLSSWLKTGVDLASGVTGILGKLGITGSSSAPAPGVRPGWVSATTYRTPAGAIVTPTKLPNGLYRLPDGTTVGAPARGSGGTVLLLLAGAAAVLWASSSRR